MKQPKRSPGFLHTRIISTVSIAMVLFLIGVITLLGLIGHSLQEFVREQFTFSVSLPAESSPADIKRVGDELRAQPFVKEITFHSKEEALQSIIAELGENPEDVVGWNPLQPSYEVTVKSGYIASSDSLAQVEKTLRKYAVADQLGYKQDLIKRLNHNLRTATIVMIGIALVLLTISVVLIHNTIRLLIYSKRFLIYSMRLVGATHGFIRRPFVAQGVFSGFFAALIALAFLAWLWVYLLQNYPYMHTVLTLPVAGIVAGVVVVLGVIIALFSSVVAVNKYLNMNINKLYRV